MQRNQPGIGIQEPPQPPTNYQMKSSSLTNTWQQKVLLLLGLTALSSCSMPPGQAWRMIQRDGLLNYWGYANGHAPMYARSSPPLMRQSLAYRPSYPRYGESWTPIRSSQPISRSLSSNRYTAPSVPSLTYSTPRPPSKSSYSAPKATKSKPKVASKSPSPRKDTTRELVTDNLATKTPSKASTSENKKPAPPAKKPSDLPFGSVVAGRPNMVNSPYAGSSQLVDVAGMSPGQTVKCPYSGKLFKVPPTQQAANKAQSKLEPKDDDAAAKSDPPKASEDKKP